MAMTTLVTVLATMLVTGLPAQAGAWEETLLDPPPARIEPDVTYTFGYWILQHGSYPYQGGDLGPTALTATNEKGTVLRFPGTMSATDGHYSAEVRFPYAGWWTIGSDHGLIMPDTLVATVTVPGGVEIAPSMMTERAPWKWGEIRPSFPPSAPGADMNAPAGALPETAVPLVGSDRVEPRSQTTATADRPGAELPGWLPIAGGVLVLGLASWLVRRYRRTNA